MLRLLALLPALLLPLPASSAVAPYPADALVFVTTGVIDKILSAADDSSYQLPGLEHASLHVIRIRADFANHPGQLQAQFEVLLPGTDQPLRLHATGRLQPEMDTKRPGRLLLRPQLTTLQLDRRAGENDAKAHTGLFGNALQMLSLASIKGALNSLASSMQALDLDLQRQITLAQPASTHAVEFRIGGADVDATVQVPALSLGLRVSTRELVFSSRGLFALLDIGNPATPAPQRQIVDTDPTLLDPLPPANNPVFVHIRGNTLARLSMALNRLPAQSRTINLYSNWSHGKLFSRRRLGLGCGSHGRLINPAAVVGGFSLGEIQAQWQPRGLALSLPLWVEMGAQARVSIHGFPAPCGLTSPRPRCRCARGKTRFRVQSRVSEPVRLFAEVGFEASGDGGIDYQLTLDAPKALKLSPQLQLGRIGSLSVPATLPLPLGVIAAGRLPLLLQQRGQIHLGIPATRRRDYQLKLTNEQLRVDDSGLAAGFSLRLTFSR